MALSTRIQQDLEAGCSRNARTGRPGLTGEQTLRILIVRQLTGWTYAELSFHLLDSATYRAFCRLGSLTTTSSKSALAATIRRVRPATLAAMNDALVTSDAARSLEPARTVRMDATVVPMAIHPPTDSRLLLDAVRSMDRLLHRAEGIADFTAYHCHHTRAKRRALAILHAAPSATQLRTLLPHVAQVIDQTRRRVLQDEKVPAEEKIVSLCEAHTDVIVKDRRDTYHGHKIFLTTGASNLILDCVIPKGNPADVTWTVPLLKRVFGLARCVWKGATAFLEYVRTAVFAANLLLLARHRTI